MTGESHGCGDDSGDDDVLGEKRVDFSRAGTLNASEVNEGEGMGKGWVEVVKFESIESEYEWPLPNHAGEVEFETGERGLDVGKKKALDGTRSPDDEGAVAISGEACRVQAFKVVLEGT